MDKLPTEVLLNIFAFLHFCEKRECILVCRVWLNLIFPMSLPDTVHITREDPIPRLGQVLNSQRLNKAKITDLVIHSVHFDEENLYSYQECFPMVRSLYLKDCYCTNSSNKLNEQHSQRKEKLMSWIDKIEVLEQYSSSPFAPNGFLPPDQCLLAVGTYSALKTLVFMTAEKSRMKINFWANAPNLTSLTLGEIIISTYYLEIIHSSLLFLKSLELQNVSLEPLKAPTFVTPSEVITTLLITTRHDDANKETRLILDYLGYIRRKYTNLVEFRFLIGSQNPVSNKNEEMIFNSEMLPLVKHIGSKARFVEIDCCNMLSQLFELMNSTGFQAGCLKLSSACSALKKHRPLFSNLDHFMRELTLNVNSSKWISNFSSLMRSIETLNIKGNHNFQYHGSRPYTTVCLRNILRTCSNSLSTLRIEKFGVDAPISTYQSYPLAKLQILSPCISPAACNFIACSFPNLRYLELGFLKVRNPNVREFGVTIYGLSEMMNRNIELGSINLYRLNLHVEPHRYIKIKTNMNNRTRHFYTPKESMSGMNWKVANHRCIWGTLGQTAHEEEMVHSHKMIYLEFNYVQLLYINNMVAN